MKSSCFSVEFLLTFIDKYVYVFQKLLYLLLTHVLMRAASIPEFPESIYPKNLIGASYMVIGIYARKSVYRDNSDSVQVQIKTGREYAKIIFKGQKLEFRIYDRDEGFSGKNTDRPSFTELMEDIRANRLDVVIVYKLDRISRSVKDFSEMYEVLERHNVTFLSVKESFDTSTPIGRTVMYILAAFAQLERETTSERVTDNMLALGESGRWTGGKLPIGFHSVRKIVDGKEHSFLIADPEMIKTPQMLFELFLSGYTSTKLERYCRDNGIKSREGKYMSSSQICAILSNPVYCKNDTDAYDYFKNAGHKVPEKSHFDGRHGLIAYGRTKQSDKTIKNNSWSIAIGIHSGIISGADFRRVQERFGQNQMFRDNKYEIGILKGIVKCECGSRVDIRTYCKNGNIFSYYYCAQMARKGKGQCNTEYIKVSSVDELFINGLKQLQLNPDGIQLQEDTSPYINIDSLRTEISNVESSIENLTSALMDHMGSSASQYIVKKIEHLDADKKRLEDNLRKAEIINASAASAADTKQIIYNNICTLLENFDKLSYMDKNELVKKTVKCCILGKNGLRIVF